jgi:sodium-dependent dicarboxylate transporter 2/3/5
VPRNPFRPDPLKAPRNDFPTMRRIAAEMGYRPDASILQGLVGARWWPIASVGLGPVLGSLAFLAAETTLPGREGLTGDAKVMLGIFVLAAWYWTTAAIPPFATGVLIMGLGALFLGYPASDGRPFALPAGGSTVADWTDFIEPAAAPVVILMLGGFILGKAAHKTGFDNLLARVLLTPFAHSPAKLILGVLLVTAVLSMWMSNTATAVMMCTLVGPLCFSLEKSSGLRRALLIAVPVGANVGGIGTPIGTPPNAIAFGALKAAGIEIDFLGWMTFAIPLVAVLLLVSWGAILVFYKFDDADREKSTSLDMPPPERGGLAALITAATFGFTVALWVTSPWTGLPIAAAALVPLMVFTASGIMSRNDINTLEWDILLLIAGGLALGGGMEATGLAAWMVDQIPLAGLPALAVILVVSTMTLVMSTLMSNTATANLLMPIALGLAGVAGGVPSGDAALAPMQAGVAVALGASLAMGLPVSTPPNAVSFAAGGLAVRDFLRMGIIVGVVGLGATLVVGALVG